jgi:hypothetical protein
VKERQHMFELYPGALEAEMGRRRELAFGSMRASRGAQPKDRRVPGTVRFRHVLAVISIALG